MAFTDPQIVTVNAVAQTLPRISTSGLSSIYKSADENLRLDISHQETKAGRTRHMARLTKRVVAADPLTAQKEYKEGSFYFVFDEPEYGFTDTELGELSAALSAWLGTAGVTGKILGSEH